MRHLHVRDARHFDPSVPTPLPLQRMCRQPALPGQQLPDLSRQVLRLAADPRYSTEDPVSPGNWNSPDGVTADRYVDSIG